MKLKVVLKPGRTFHMMACWQCWFILHAAHYFFLAVPPPKLYLQVNPMQVTLDPLSLLWLNAFSRSMQRALAPPPSVPPPTPPYMDVHLEAVRQRVSYYLYNWKGKLWHPLKQFCLLTWGISMPPFCCHTEICSRVYIPIHLKPSPLCWRALLQYGGRSKLKTLYRYEYRSVETDNSQYTIISNFIRACFHWIPENNEEKAELLREGVHFSTPERYGRALMLQS